MEVENFVGHAKALEDALGKHKQALSKYEVSASKAQGQRSGGRAWGNEIAADNDGLALIAAEIIVVDLANKLIDAFKYQDAVKKPGAVSALDALCIATQRYSTPVISSLDAARAQVTNPASAAPRDSFKRTTSDEVCARLVQALELSPGLVNEGRVGDRIFKGTDVSNQDGPGVLLQAKARVITDPSVLNVPMETRLRQARISPVPPGKRAEVARLAGEILQAAGRPLI